VSAVAAVSAVAPTTVPVALGARAYDIVIGAGAARDFAPLRALRPGLRRLFLVADETVARLHGGAVAAAAAAAGFAVERVVVPPGERSKSFARLEALAEDLLARRLERADVLVALGGGVVGDLAGFAAAVLLRGLDFVQVPTTLLAQVDSAVGGKTAINARAGKNLVGAFHQPILVLADTELVDTLPLAERRGGYAEIAKYGLIDRPDFFAWLEGGAGRAVVERAGPERQRAVVESCRAKAAIVAADERESGARALLNLGHTFAHAIEAEAGYDGAVGHGQAVALGCAMAFDLSARLGLAPATDAARVAAHVAAIGLPTALADLPLAGGAWSAARLIDHMGRDKKVADGKLTFILARGVGRAFVARDVPAAPVIETLRRFGAA
jgi:3-dehydroquinate synthase